MRWQNREGSRNIQDRRGQAMKIGGGLGLGTILIAVFSLLMGEDPMRILQQIGSGSGAQEQPTELTGTPTDEMGQFVGVVLKETENVWTQVFRDQLQQEYTEPVLVLFDGTVESACGMASSATGPFYCPGDDQVYIDLSFYRDLQERFQAPGDFAMAYVIAHEVGHHVQNLLGISAQVQQQRGRVSQAEYNQLSQRLELQADFLAGVWAHFTQREGLLEEGDIEEALGAANAIGDDRIQMQTQGRVVPDAFTHGTSEQRMRWFTRGYKTGDLSQGDTFRARDL